jgi:hypothetical protein
MKYSITILFLAICSFAHAQTTVLTTDPSLPIPKFSFDEKGDLKITASATSSPSDFDFLVEFGPILAVFELIRKQGRPFLMQGYVQGKPYYHDVSLGCSKQGSPRVEPGVFFRQRQNLEMELV